MARNDFLELPDQSVAEIVAAFDGIVPQKAQPKRETGSFLKSCELVADANRISLKKVGPLPEDLGEIELLDYTSNRAGFRYRQVYLTGDWWRWDHGPLLVFRASDHEPCALVPDRGGRYRLVEPDVSDIPEGRPITRTRAVQLENYGYWFYRSLPDRPLTWRDLLRFGLEGLRHDVNRLFVVLAASGVLGLVLPVSIGIVFDHVIPSANFDLLTQFVVAVVVTSLAVTLFGAAELIALTRLEFKMNASLQAAVWDRLLRLPLPFFREFTAGDLSDRVSGIDEIQRAVSTELITSALASVFSVFSLALMFYYDVRLAGGALALALLFAAVNVAATIRQLPHQREVQRLEGENRGFMLQVLTGITKLRVADKIETAFSLWLSRFVRTTRLLMRTEMIRIRLFVFASVYSVLLTAFLFAMVAALGRDLSLGSFMAFSALYGGFFASMIAMSDAVAGSLEIVPFYERVKPILDALPEATSSGTRITDLSGQVEIQIDRVSFRYPNDETKAKDTGSQNIFSDLDITVAPGEYIALVGPSGCGKSTLFRLLLGLERPLSGSIYYGGNNLLDVDVTLLRSRIGVVLQNSNLMPGTILENIFYGAQHVSEEQAWRAAQLACIDQEIESLPMGMHTYLSENGKNFSAGQRQRMLLARAFAKEPTILLLDEATSAVDNATQAGIIANIRDLGITCIAAAHRLSTVRAATRILVLDQGRIVQQGSFSELVAEPGLFSRMKERQSV